MVENITVLDTKNPKELLFHYTSKETALEHIISSREILMGRYQETNDPRENKRWSFMVNASGLSGEFQEAADRSWEAIERVQRNLRVLCLTADHASEPLSAPPELRGYGRARMWAQYAGNNTGICLVFDRETLADAVSVATGDPKKLWCGFVHYEVLSEAFKLSDSHNGAYKFDLNTVEILGGMEPAIQSYIENHGDVLLFRKSLDWRDETEYRWVFRADEGRGDIRISIERALKCVVVGVDFPRQYYPSLRQMCQHNDVKIMRMGWYKGHFERPYDIPED